MTRIGNLPFSRGVVTWLLRRSLARGPWRAGLEAVTVAFPVAMLAATLWYVDTATQSMTPNALSRVQVEMRAVAKSLDADMTAISAQLAQSTDVALVEPFAAAKVLVGTGNSGLVTARLFAVRPNYIAAHPWIKTVMGSLDKGVLLSQSVKESPDFAAAETVTITLPGDAPDFSLTLPVGGVVDLRDATTWFSIPYGEVQGDIVTVPRAVVVDFATFETKLLPTLRDWSKLGGLPPFDPGSNELPAANLEAHVTIDHASYPPDPGLASIWTGQLQKALGRLSNSSVIIADNAAESLAESQIDATNAKMLFLLLGIPGVVVAAAIGLTGASALVDSYRREEALLRMRGASTGQVAGLAMLQAAVAGLAGSILGLLIAALAVSAVVSHPVWRNVPAGNFALSAGLAVMAGALSSSLRLFRLWRASRGSDLAERQLLTRGWTPFWRLAYLDLVALAVGAGILAVNVAAGGLKSSPIEGMALMLSFYILLAPVAFWVGGSLLAARLLLGALERWTRPERARPLVSWTEACFRWLGRRPAHAARAMIAGTLAVAFGAEVLTFSATYQTAREADAMAALGSDLRITPGDPRFALPPLGDQIMATSPVRLVPTRIDTDRKTVMAIDPASYAAAATIPPRMIEGAGLSDLIANPNGVMINAEIAKDFELGIGDTLELTIFPDDFESAKDIGLKVVGIYSAFPPTFPETEAVATVAGLPRAELAWPDFYLARVGQNLSPEKVAHALFTGPLAQKFVAATQASPNQRGLTALNLEGLRLIEAMGASLIAALGVSVLGAFLVLERRREFAILQTIGAETRRILAAPALEGGAVVLAALAFGIPIGTGLGMLAVKVLGLFFNLKPPLLTLPLGGLAAMSAFVIVISGVAIGLSLFAVTRTRPASILRAP